MRAMLSGAVGAVAAASALRLLRRRPPGGAALWDRTNHAGATVTLLEGPAFALGAAAGAAFGGAGPGPVLATAASAAFGALDDLAGDSTSKGLKGHLGALARGQVTTGALKVLGLGVTGVLAAGLIDRRARTPGSQPRSIRASAVDTLLGGAVVAGSANLLNLLDLRPGRALKATIALAALCGTAPRSEGAAGAAAGAAAGVLHPDLVGAAMLGDTGANSAGALLGSALVQRTGRRGRLVALVVLAGLTLASEKVSFTSVIESTPVLRELDALGRR
jgi:hypothetical protein